MDYPEIRVLSLGPELISYAGSWPQLWLSVILKSHKNITPLDMYLWSQSLAIEGHLHPEASWGVACIAHTAIRQIPFVKQLLAHSWSFHKAEWVKHEHPVAFWSGFTILRLVNSWLKANNIWRIQPSSLFERKIQEYKWP